MIADTTNQRFSSPPAPPSLPGLPVVGHALEFQRDPVGLFRRGYERLGPIFGIRLGPQRAVVILGPEANRFFFTETDKLLSMREVYRFLIPMFGDKLAFVAEPDEYREQRTILLPAFSGRKVDGYVAAMVCEVEDWLDTLGDQGQFELVESFGLLTMFIATRAFFGAEFREQAGAKFFPLFRDLAGGIEFLLPPGLPLPRFIRRDRAKARLQRMIGAIIAERRVGGVDHDDLLQTLLEAQYSDGRPLPDHLIVNLILGFIFAGHETTQGHACWALIQLLQHPAYLERVRAEQTAVLGADGALTASSVRELHQLAWALKETERMQPTVRVLMRYTVAPYELHGYHVPRGWLTVASPDVSQHLPDVFSQPARYDPDRFAPDRAEDRHTPFSMIAFGGGLHKCLGMHFAYTEMTIILSLLLQRFELELADPNPKPTGGPGTSRPSPPCPVRYRRRAGGERT